MFREKVAKAFGVILLGGLAFGQTAAQAPVKCMDLRMNVFYEEVEATGQWQGEYANALMDPNYTNDEASALAEYNATSLYCANFLYGTDPNVAGNQRFQRKQCWMIPPSWQANSNGEHYWGDSATNPAKLIKTGCKPLSRPDVVGPVKKAPIAVMPRIP